MSRHQRTILAMTTLPSIASPPKARREEDRAVLVGKVEGPTRQSEASTEPLLDPPVSVPDPYGWMRDETRTNQEVLDHLRAENAYTEALTSHLGDLRESLYKELLSSIQETDYSLPRPRGDYVYYSRTIEGKAYTVYCRAPKPADDFDMTSWDGSADSPILPNEEILLDVNELAKGKSYCDTGTVKTSPSHKFLAYTADFSGDEV